MFGDRDGNRYIFKGAGETLVVVGREVAQDYALSLLKIECVSAISEIRVSCECRILAGASHFSATNDYRNTAKIKKTIAIPDAGFSVWGGRATPPSSAANSSANEECQWHIPQPTS